MDLTLDSVSILRGGQAVVSAVSASFRPGRITVILGPNGAGKSSLIKAIAALIPSTGSIAIGGRPVTAMAPRERARQIGYLPQDGVIHWNLRVAEAVALGRAPHRAAFAAAGEEDRAAIADALAATETTAFADRLLDTLSGGERARVLLARVLAGRPGWLLADEPLASLDPAHQIDILARLGVLARAGMGIVLVLHDLAQAARLADDVLLLKAGRSVAFGPAAEVMTAAALGALFDVEVAIARTPAGRAVPLVTGRRGR